ncbi:MAG: hypothetical protein DRN12_06175 [Thermoplasmata archaeon]|nr:MAG: hypothetical protein DRN12_06175 [Thermoplasmata archaeon]
MKMNIVCRDELARITSIDKRLTPNVFFISTQHIMHPEFADFILESNIVSSNNIEIVLEEKEDEIECPLVTPLGFPEAEFKNHKLTVADRGEYKDKGDTLVILPYGRQIFENPSLFVDKILSIRRRIGWEKLFYIPGIGSPMSYALLAYMGIDFFDSLNAIVAARRGELLFPIGSYSINELEEIPCSCPACRASKTFSFQDILQHNYYMIYQELKLVRNAIRLGKIRELVEQRVRVKPHLISILRFFDRKGFKEIEKYVPLVKSNSFLVLTEDSFNRVEVKRFQQRVIDRYIKPRNPSILLLLPCSYRKPYSFSPSHRRFNSILQQLDNRYILHEVIVTSPIGVVPRELELVYPVANYDIPVTGVWSDDEEKMIQGLLKKYLEKNRYKDVVLYLPEELRRITSEVIRNPIIVESKENLTSKKTLDKLLEVLKDLTEKYNYVSYDERRLEDMRSFLSYQFGKEIADVLIRKSTIKGRYPNLRIISNGKQIGMLTGERGFVSLTLEGAERLASTGRYYVEIDRDFKLKGSVFAPGVISADQDIRIGDEVCIMQDDKLCAVGVAKMPGEDMVLYQHGEAVNVRHRI